SFCTRDDGDRDRTFDLVLGHDGVDPDITGRGMMPRRRSTFSTNSFSSVASTWK
ncbi:unnamed protein product, partial [Ascophyllum nodosum]